MNTREISTNRSGSGLKTMRVCSRLQPALFTAVLVGIFGLTTARAVTNVFFDASQTTNLVTSGTTSDTISSEGYLFTFTRDKLFTGGVGLTNPIGRTVRIPWPDGLEAQAVTAGPNPSGARLDIERQDGELFAIESLSFKLLANTAGAGAALEIMPLLDGEDGVPEPFMYNATGYYGQQFAYNTPELTGFDAYKITLYVDFAVTSLTAIDASLPPPSLEIVRLNAAAIQIAWPTNVPGYTLEFTTSLPAPGWTSITNDVVVNGELFTVQLNDTEPHRFFRLRK
jgi:hypothetical protein